MSEFKKKITLVITAFKEPNVSKAIEAALNQKTKQKYKIIVSAPDKQTLNLAKKYSKKVKIIKDPGKGKSYAINFLLPKIETDIIILTDGDVFISENAIDEIMKSFEDEKVGCVTGRPKSTNPKNNMLGYWSHVLVDAGMHIMRFNRNKKDEFIECSGYLWAFRNKIIKKFPLDMAEDTIVPAMFWLKGWKIAYAKKAEVYVKYPATLKEFIKQKRRAAASHENIQKYINPKKVPRMKTFFNEIIESPRIFFYAKDVKEILWTFLLFPIRLYIWLNLLYHIKIRKRYYTDAWKRITTTK